MARQHLATGGKRLRARLALAAASALGGHGADAVGWAAACELAHNATLIHDDLQDGDEIRRGHPTTWVVHGMAQAINAGDLLLMLPYLAIDTAPVDGAVRASLCRAMAEGVARVIRGQASECALTHHGRPSRALYEAIIRGKTAALFELPVQGAALLVGHAPGVAQRFSAPFCHLGMLFQMQDDVLDLFGDKGRAQLGSDIREGKISALVVEHLALNPADETWLLQILRQPREQTHDAAVVEVINRFRQGALTAVLEAIRRDAAVARQQAASLGIPALAALLNDLVTRVLEPIVHLI
jgi:geranylgeranyl diphosphate synthase type I